MKRNLSNNNKQPQNHAAPEINIDPKGNTLLHQKAVRAAELHAELNELLDKQAKRRAEEMNRPFGAGFLDFMKNSKSEIINIFAAFTCVLLAWQISNIRKGARKLLDDAGEKEIRMEKLKQILRVISNDSFTERVAKAYEERLEKSKLYELEQKGKRWLFGQSKTKAVVAQKNENSNELLKDVIQKELSKTIGDLALTDYELEEKKLQSLQQEMGILEREDNTKNNGEESLGGLERVLTEVNQDTNADAKVVKRKGFI